MKKAQIKDFPNYIITDTGDVYSIVGHIKKIKPYNSRGYLRVTLSKNNVNTHKSVHRLVAEAFIPNPGNKPQVNHKNGIKTDNRVENLEFCTASENTKHAFDVLGRKANKPWLNKFGKDNYLSKLVLQIQDGKIIAEFYGTQEAERKTNIKSSNIRKCCKGIRNTAGGYQWKYKEQ